MNLNNISRMGGDGSECGIGLLGVTSNKLVTFSRQNSRAHAVLLQECNYTCISQNGCLCMVHETRQRRGAREIEIKA